MCEFDLYLAHLAALSGLVVRHSRPGESSQAVLGKLESFSLKLRDLWKLKFNIARKLEKNMD